jgi:hypothetical protein
MSYRTWHTLGFFKEDAKTEVDNKLEIVKALREFAPDVEDFLDEDGSTNDEDSWPGMDEEMREFSKQWPDVVFYIHGEGEEDPDLWDAYYKNGQAQYCPAVITYPDYCESELM